MGVKRLKTYLLANNHVCKVRLKNVADAWRSCGGNSIILVDTHNLLKWVGVYSETLCCGGEYPALETRFLQIINAFEALSIELVFCLDGSSSEDKIYLWKERQMEKLMNYMYYFPEIEFRKVEYFKEADIFSLLSASIAEETAKLRCQVVHTEGDPDLFMARYVINNKCLGIITEDTDFVIFDGIPNVFLPDELVKNICFSSNEDGTQFNPNLLETSKYMRVKFASSIGLQLEAFPIFATLAGNDFFGYLEIKDYMMGKFGLFEFSQVVFKLVSIANRIHGTSGGDVEKASISLAYEMFDRRYFKDVMAKSLRSYDLRYFDAAPSLEPIPSWKSTNTQWTFLVEQVRKRTLYKNCSFTRDLITLQRYKQSARFDNIHEPCGVTLRDFRRRIYSVLLHEKTGEREFVEELVVTRPYCFQCIWLVGTVKVEVYHPGLWNLYFGGREYDRIRWKLVCWVMCSTQSETVVNVNQFERLINLPDELKLVGLSIFYLYWVIEKITKKEALHLMLMASIIAVCSPEMLKEFSMAKKITKERAVCIATLYQETHECVKCIAINSKCYSGHLFHWLFKFRENVNLEHKLPPEVWEIFELLKAALKN